MALSTIKSASILDGSLSASDLAAGSVESYLGTQGSAFGFRNRIINGAMMIDQRNAGASVTGTATNVVYTLDRWMVYSVGANSLCQQVPGPSTYEKALQVVPAAGSALQVVGQRIESKNCTDLAGQTVTFSGKIYIDNISGVSCAVVAYAAAATDSNYVTPITGFSVTLVAGSYVQFSGNLTLPSSAGNGIELDINFYGVAGRTIKITGVQLEKGSTATSFDYRPYGTELALCQRYYNKWAINSDGGGYATWGAGYVFSSTAANINVSYPVQMRATATFTQSNCCVLEASGAFGLAGIISTYAGQQSALLTVGVASGLTTGRGATLGGNNNVSAYIAASAEL